jgi:hypothetical protein
LKFGGTVKRLDGTYYKKKHNKDPLKPRIASKKRVYMKGNLDEGEGLMNEANDTKADFSDIRKAEI